LALVRGDVQRHEAKAVSGLSHASFRRISVAVFSLTLSSLLADAARADDASTSASLPPLVIGATKLPTPEDELGSTVTVITADDIEKRQLRTMPDVLQTVPGLNIVQSGGIGGQASVFMRGTNSNHTKVFIDGIDMADPTTSSGAFDFAHLTTDDIERVEVLRGPQSGLYGSDAVGGVINIITKSGKGPAQFSGGAEIGSYSTFNQNAAISGSNSRFNYRFDATHLRSNDVKVTPENLLPVGQDRIANGYDNKTFGTKLGAQVSDDWDVGLVARYINSHLSTIGDDSNFPSSPATEKTYSDTRQLFTRGTAHTTSFDGLLDQTFGIAHTDYRRRDSDPNNGLSYNDGDTSKVDWQGNVPLGRNNTVVGGLEHQYEEVYGSASAHADISSGYLELQSSYDNRYFNTVNVRHDEHQAFGGDTTYRIAPSMLFPESDTRLKGSVGTAFKAPSLNQLYVGTPAFGFFGNPSLQPEKSIGYDAGFEQSALEKKVRFGSTYFHNDITNLIAANTASTTNINIGHAETYGFENFVAVKATTDVTVRGDYTYTMATDEVKHQELQRRPKHKASVTSIWQATPDVSLAATVLYVGSWNDGNRDFSVSRMNTDSYTVVNLAGTYDLGNGVTAYARIDNLFDKDYQDPVGFDRPGLGVFGGFKVDFKIEDLVK
jgi:vitamin B12 transporter